MNKTEIKLKVPSRDLRVHMTELREKDPKVHEFLRLLENVAIESRTDYLSFSDTEKRWRIIEDSCTKTLPELKAFCNNCNKDFEDSCREQGECLHIG